jgi:hypothetical protein
MHQQLEVQVGEFKVIMVPPEGHDQTFKEVQTVTDPSTGEDVSQEVERPFLRDIRLNAHNEDAARRICERQAENIAAQEVVGQYPDDPDSADAAAHERTWVIQSIEEVGAAPAKKGSDK